MRAGAGSVSARVRPSSHLRLRCDGSRPAPRRRAPCVAALVAKVLASSLPDGMSAAPCALDAVRACVHEFVRALASESSTICEAQRNKIIQPAHVLAALRALEFDSYAQALEAEAAQDAAGKGETARPAKRKKAPDIPAAELERQQADLFAAARAAAAVALSDAAAAASR